MATLSSQTQFVYLDFKVRFSEYNLIEDLRSRVIVLVFIIHTCYNGFCLLKPLLTITLWLSLLLLLFYFFELLNLLNSLTHQLINQLYIHSIDAPNTYYVPGFFVLFCFCFDFSMCQIYATYWEDPGEKFRQTQRP